MASSARAQATMRLDLSGPLSSFEPCLSRCGWHHRPALQAEREKREAYEAAVAEVKLGLGRIVALRCRSSTSHRIH
jgi:hypothetical protein